MIYTKKGLPSLIRVQKGSGLGWSPDYDEVMFVVSEQIERMNRATRFFTAFVAREKYDFSGSAGAT